MSGEGSGDFLSFLAASGLTHPAGAGTAGTLARPLRQVWEASELTAGDFADEVARFYRLPRIALPELMAAPSLVSHFTPRFLREMTVLPFRAADGTSCLAVGDPTDETVVRAAEIVLGGKVTRAVASFEDIATALAERLGADEAAAREAAGPATARAEDDIDSLRDLASGAPVVRAVNDLFDKAMELRASDIHIGPFRTGLEVRLRIDGMLRPIHALADVLPQAVISRIKILAGLDIAERRLPQDGAARLKLGRDEIDVRVAIMPTQHGESAVIRLLARDRGVLTVDKLGLAPHDRETLMKLLALPHGMVVVTGPTGSGKTTTLATILSVLNEPTRKILTIEDPVEYEIRGVFQSQVRPQIGLTFAAALRSFLRQDPDVIMVGEVRDPETAHIAVHAALTGHLVLTTLHTDTAAASVPRLLDLGVEGFLLKSTLRAVIAQRLVRQLCERCKRPHTLSASDVRDDPRYAALGLKAGETVYEPVGCERCGGAGYRGRIGVFEVLTLSDDIREMIDRHAGAAALDRAAIAGGMTTMLDDGVAKCRAGLTSAAEVLRVTTVR
ncbi:general secretion pathway protein E [Xanthobacter flavus]|uniref:General secretion pathway protein E n=1 Tax=Xanthobacter flavus TaxID=281 RepID=A0A9W6CKN5_XANFL|nr:GspE/PulE family protein [Xanthobacter flavus]MDR6335272.1 general secretion pathway protein E [Xanthobacter flavus]GLI24178.1 general secretion pathway protein GspE [Xanthobacter flavus]